MKLNEAGWDRVVRIVLGLVLLALGWGDVVTGGWGLAFKIVGFLPLITGLIGDCPTYALLRTGTRRS